MYTVVYPDSISSDNFSIEKKLTKGSTKLISLGAKNIEEIPAEILQKADALVTGIQLKIDKQLIKKLKCCKIITRAGVGYDLIDIKAAGKAGIAVCNVPDYGTYEVADHAIALILNFARGISIYDKLLQQDLEANWSYLKAPSVSRLSGRILGIVGLGRIGTACALRAKAFGLDVVFYDPYVPDGQDKALNIKRIEQLPDLLSQSDYVSIHCLANEETSGLFDSALFKFCKPGQVLVNTARGVIVDLDSLYDCLKAGQLAAAGLDVFSSEPPPKENKLIRAWCDQEDWLEGRLVLTPHSAFYSPDGLKFLRNKALKTCLDYLNNRSLVNCVNNIYLNK